MRLALYTFGQFIGRADDRSNDGFHAMNDPVFAAVDRAEGLIARSGYASDDGPEPWGAEIYPRFYRERGDGWSPATLSLWRDLESLFAFTYSGLHARAMSHGREWFQQPDWPPLVLWWHAGPAHPVWAEGAARLEHLHDHGPTPHAFTFKAPFDRAGEPTRIDPDRVRTLKATAAPA